MKNTFVTIARYQYSYEAHIIRGKLESEGIKVFMADDSTIDVHPFISNAIGGFKLKVLSEDVDSAKQILDATK